MKIKQFINVDYDKLSTQQKLIHDYIINHVEEVQKMTITQLSNELFSSRATIDRYLKKANISGFKELKQVLLNFEDDKYYENDVINLFKDNKDKRILVVGFGSSYISALYLERRLSYLGFDIVAQNVSQLIGFKQNFNLIIIISNSGNISYYEQLINEYTQVTTLSITQKGSELALKTDYLIDNKLASTTITKRNHDNQIQNFLIIENLFNML